MQRFFAGFQCCLRRFDRLQSLLLKGQVGRQFIAGPVLIGSVFLGITGIGLLHQCLNLGTKCLLLLFQGLISHGLVSGTVGLKFGTIKTDMPQGDQLHLHRQLDGLHKTVLKKCRMILAKIT